MIRVRFNRVAEFLDELEKDVGSVDRLCDMDDNIVRVTIERRSQPAVGPFAYYYVLATYMARGQLVYLDHYVCRVFGDIETPDVVLESAQAIVRQVQLACDRIGINCRAGVLEEVPA